MITCSTCRLSYLEPKNRYLFPANLWQTTEESSKLLIPPEKEVASDARQTIPCLTNI